MQLIDCLVYRVHRAMNVQMVDITGAEVNNLLCYPTARAHALGINSLVCFRKAVSSVATSDPLCLAQKAVML